MLNITRYLWVLVLIVTLGGLWYPYLGYVMAVVMLTLMITALFRGRWFCGNLCPRGSFNDFVLNKISRKRNIPGVLRSLWVRVPLFILIMSLMIYRVSVVFATRNMLEKIGVILASMCIVTTVVAILLGGFYNSRAWCTVCPMGTAQRIIGGDRYQLKMADELCIDCKKCEKVCPMELTVRDIGNNPDCIKCGRCVEACPKDALYF
jgi:polyferredoxin